MPPLLPDYPATHQLSRNKHFPLSAGVSHEQTPTGLNIWLIVSLGSGLNVSAINASKTLLIESLTA
jgi:hypothetical protein